MITLIRFDDHAWMRTIYHNEEMYIFEMVPDRNFETLSELIQYCQFFKFDVRSFDIILVLILSFQIL